MKRISVRKGSNLEAYLQASQGLHQVRNAVRRIGKWDPDVGVAIANMNDMLEKKMGASVLNELYWLSEYRKKKR